MITINRQFLQTQTQVMTVYNTLLMEQKREFYSETFRSLGHLKLWQARHSMVLDFIEQHKVLNMLDLGTSESTLLMKVQRGLQVSHMVGIDIDDIVINQAVDNLMPQGIQNDFQYLRQYNQVVRLYKGSALIKYPQLKQGNFQLITMVEVIEHIEEKYLPQLNENVFNYLRPKWVWISTPNCQFNPLFKWQQPNKKFRHDDHKFQWTRKEFQDYVDGVCQKYQYKATITGVGLAVDDANLDKGFCTQIAIFQRLYEDDDDSVLPQTIPQTTKDKLFDAKKHTGNPSVPLELKHEHVNLCWKSNIDHLLKIAMSQLILECNSKGSLDWHQVTSILRKKTIIKKLKEHNSEWSFDYHIKSFVFQYFNKNPEKQIACSSVGLCPTLERDNRSIDFTMMDQEFEREMSEWKTFSNEEQSIIEAEMKAINDHGFTIYEYDSNESLFRRRVVKSRKAKSEKSGKSKNSSGSQSASSSSSSYLSQSRQNSENSWGSVQFVEDKSKRRKRKRSVGRIRNQKQGQIIEDKESIIVVDNKSEK